MQRKLHLKPDKECNWMMTEGTRMEPWVVHLYETVMRDECWKSVELFVDGGRDDVEDARFGGSVDRIVRLPCGTHIVLECKTAYSAVQRDEIPHGHLLQMLGLCHAYALPYAHYACYQEGIGFFLAEVRFDEALWRDHVYPRLCQFAMWYEKGVLPPKMPTAEKVDLIKTIHRLSSVCKVTREQARQ